MSLKPLEEGPRIPDIRDLWNFLRGWPIYQRTLGAFVEEAVVRKRQLEEVTAREEEEIERLRRRFERSLRFEAPQPQQRRQQQRQQLQQPAENEPQQPVLQEEAAHEEEAVGVVVEAPNFFAGAAEAPLPGDDDDEAQEAGSEVGEAFEEAVEIPQLVDDEEEGGVAEEPQEVLEAAEAPQAAEEEEDGGMVVGAPEEVVVPEAPEQQPQQPAEHEEEVGGPAQQQPEAAGRRRRRAEPEVRVLVLRSRVVRVPAAPVHEQADEEEEGRNGEGNEENGPEDYHLPQIQGLPGHYQQRLMDPLVDAYVRHPDGIECGFCGRRCASIRGWRTHAARMHGRDGFCERCQRFIALPPAHTAAHAAAALKVHAEEWCPRPCTAVLGQRQQKRQRYEIIGDEEGANRLYIPAAD